jgi:voltage-gated potassium channel
MRMKLHKFKSKYIFRLINLLDIVIIASIFIRYYYWDNALLHFFTALKILRSYRVIHDLSKVNTFFEKNKDLIFSILNLLMFTFFMASLVFIAQVDINENINTFLDALYFTLATLTTTWFWDITVIWDMWKLLAILIMTLWTWLFLRLVTVIFRPIKKYAPCQHCWLKKHDKDASHCKHCWNIMYIENNWETVE